MIFFSRLDRKKTTYQVLVFKGETGKMNTNVMAKMGKTNSRLTKRKVSRIKQVIFFVKQNRHLGKMPKKSKNRPKLRLEVTP